MTYDQVKIELEKSSPNNEVINSILHANPGCINEQDSEGKTLLHIACSVETIEPEIVQTLLKYDFDKLNYKIQDSSGWTPLYYACEIEPINFDIITLLCKKEFKDSLFLANTKDFLPIHQCCKNPSGSPQIISKLLEHDENKTTLLKLSSNGENPLIYVTSFFVLKACKNIIPDTKEYFEKIELLLKEDVSRNSIFCKNNYGKLALHYLTEQKIDLPVLKLLLSFDPENICILSQDSRKLFTPLHYACKNEEINFDVISLLLKNKECKKTVTWKDHHNRIPLHLASKNQNVDFSILKLLINSDISGMYLTAKDEDGETCLHYISTLFSNSEKLYDEILDLFLSNSDQEKYLIEFLAIIKETHLSEFHAKTYQKVKLLLQRDIKGKMKENINNNQKSNNNNDNQLILNLIDEKFKNFENNIFEKIEKKIDLKFEELFQKLDSKLN